MLSSDVAQDAVSLTEKEGPCGSHPGGYSTLHVLRSSECMLFGKASLYTCRRKKSSR
jgi:hypothetical protein